MSDETDLPEAAVKVKAALDKFEATQDFGEAYRMLAAIPIPPEDQTRLRVLTRFFKGMALLQEGGDRQEIMALLKEVVDETPALGESFSLIGRSAQIALIQAKGATEDLTAEERSLLESAGAGFSLDQRSLFSQAQARIEAAAEARRRGLLDEADDSFAQAEQLWMRAADLFPPTRELTLAQFALVKASWLMNQELESLADFDLETTSSVSARLLAEVDRMVSFAPAGPLRKLYPTKEAADVLRLVATDVCGLATVLQEALTRGPSAKGLARLQAIEQRLVKARTQASGMTYGASDFARAWLLRACTRGAVYARNLRSIVKPPRERVLSLTGLVVGLAFVGIVGATFFMGRAFSVDVNPTFVLVLAAFLALIVGFGYGAIRFRDFFAQAITGGLSASKKS